MPSLAKLKNEFPIFERYPGLVFLDNASTSQKPACVLAAEQNFYLNSNANVHRGVYKLAERADQIYEEARQTVADFTGNSPSQIVFTKNATEAANMLAFGIGESLIKIGDNVVVTELEHHANYLPWQEMAKRKKAEFRVVPIDPRSGQLQMKALEKMIDRKTRVVAVTQLSNVLGIMPDIRQIVELAHRQGALVVMDAAQGITHLATNFVKLGVDAAFFTGHKIFAPLGTGVLFLSDELAELIPPMLTGGGMISDLPDDWMPSPQKFEAGTPNVAGLAGLTEAIRFLRKIGLENITSHEKNLTALCRKMLGEIPQVKLFGSGDEKQLSSIVSFDVEGVHPHDLASVLAEENICIRVGHHCAKPLLQRLGKNALARASFSIYNTPADLEKLQSAIRKAIKIFK